MNDWIRKLDEDLYTIEYKWFDGAWTFRDSFIIEFVKKLRRRDLIFYNVEDLDKWNPLPYFRSVRLWFGFNGQDKCVGAFWLSSYNELNKSGFFNCGMLKDVFADEKDYIRIAHLGLKDLLNLDDVKTVYGETSVTNKTVLMLADYFGFVKLGTIPNGHWHARDKEFCDTVFMYVNKELLKDLS
jgi:RimJ/RimL family protein N-acetyltransferase